MCPVQEMKDRRGEMYFLRESPAGNGRVNTYGLVSVQYNNF